MMNTFLNMLFPEQCPLCSGPSSDHRTAPICRACWETIAPYQGTACQRCGRPLVSDASLTCGECIDEEPAFKTARSFGLYDGALKKAINLLKYYGVKRFSRPLSDIIIRLALPLVDAVIPVPLHEKRLRQREFNQSALLAKNVAERLQVPVIVNCLVKLRDTTPQVGLSLGNRKKNIRRAFAVRNEERISGKDIILVDDVFTTGATVRECSKVLKKAGANDIYVITLAHGMMD